MVDDRRKASNNNIPMLEKNTDFTRGVEKLGKMWSPMMLLLFWPDLFGD